MSSRLSLACFSMILLVVVPLPGLRTSPVEPSPNVPPSSSNMFLLNITSVYPVVSLSSQQWAVNLSRGISQLAASHGYSLTIVSTFQAWDSLLRNPPSGIIVFSAHWNWMLIPASWQNTTWQQFYTYVANLIVTKGWIMHSTDWPYYGYYREGDLSVTIIGLSATNTFFSVAGASMDAWTDSISPDVSTLTFDGSRSAAAAGLSLPTVMDGNGVRVFNHRAVQWTGVSPVMKYYQTQPGNYGVRYPASAIKMGNGFFADIQWTENLTVHAEMVFAFTVILASTYFDDFSGSQLGPLWNVENLGGNYSVANSQLTFSTTGPAVTAYQAFTPQTDSFAISARVESSTLAGFAMRIQTSSPPIFGSTAGAQLEFDSSVENKFFLAAWEPIGGGWNWKSFYGPSMTNAWYILDMLVEKNPFTITFSVLNDTGGLLGSYTVANLGFSYNSIQLIALEAWASQLSYSVDWLRVINLPPALLTGDFSWIPAIVSTGQPVAFSATAFGGSSPYQFDWNFGDASSGNGQTIVHSYFTSGNFTVSLTVIDSASSTSIVTHTIEVMPGPSLNVSLSFHSVTVNASGYFTYNSTTSTVTGIINVLAVNTTNSKTLLAKTFDISTVHQDTGTVRFILLIPDQPADLALHCGVSLNTNQTSCSISRNPDVAHRGTVDLVDFGMIAYNYGTIQGSPTYNPALDLAADGQVDIISVGIAGIDYGTPVLA